MEIKLLCDCGTKFKFEVEPVHGRMPAPVHCPSCGAEATAKANDFLRHGVTVESPASPAPSSPRTVRVHLPSPAATRTPETGGVALAPPPPRPPPSMPPMATYESAEPKQKGQLVTILVTILVILGVGFGAWKYGVRWMNRIKVVTEMSSMLGSGGSATAPATPKNLWYEDATVLFIQHTNHVEIAEACKGYWKQKFQKNLVLSEEVGLHEQNVYELIPAYNGYVRIMGEIEWPAEQFEPVAQHLSQKFNTLVFEMRQVEDSGAYHFGVYQSGTRKFHAEMTIKKVQFAIEETVTTEGNEWALAQGFKPGPGGFKQFTLADGDEITQKMGMKLWDEPEDTDFKQLVMKEVQ